MEWQESTGTTVLSLCWYHCVLTFKQELVGEGRIVVEVGKVVVVMQIGLEVNSHPAGTVFYLWSSE